MFEVVTREKAFFSFGGRLESQYFQVNHITIGVDSTFILIAIDPIFDRKRYNLSTNKTARHLSDVLFGCVIFRSSNVIYLFIWFTYIRGELVRIHAFTDDR